MGVDDVAGDECTAVKPPHVAPSANDALRVQLTPLQRFLKGCRPDWSWHSIGLVVQKLAKVGIHEIADLQESVRLGTLNGSLEEAGEKRFNTETLERLRLGPPVQKAPIREIDDEYRDFPEPRYFRVAVRCVSAQCSQSLDAKKNMARCRGEVVEALGRAGSWLRLAAIERVLDGERVEEPVWLQISSNTREDGRIAKEAETALLMLRGIGPEVLDPIVDSRNVAETGGIQLCLAVVEVKDIFGPALHTQGIVKRCSGTRWPTLDDCAIDSRRIEDFFMPTILAPGTGRLQARRDIGERVDGMGRWRVLAGRDYEADEVIEHCPLLTAAAKAQRGSMLDHRMEPTKNGEPRCLSLGLGCLYRRAKDELEANACKVVCPDLGFAFVCTTQQVRAGEELRLPPARSPCGDRAMALARRARPYERSQDDLDWAAGSVGLTAGAARLGQSVVHGRGVFAATSFREGDVVELCPGLVLDEGSQGVFQDFAMLFYEHPTSNRDVAKPISVIALGHGAMYNHQNPGYNMEWGWIEGSEIVEMRATREIQEGEELFISYGPNYWKARHTPG